MQCVKDKMVECDIDLECFTNAATATLEAIEVIANVVEGKRGWTGNTECDSCHDLSLSDAMEIVKAIRNKFELVPIKSKVGVN